MKTTRTPFVIVLLLCLSHVVYSQGFSTQIYSGINFSNIHGQTFGGKWNAKPGPSAGLNVRYSLGKTVGFESGINYSTVYYEHVTQQMAYSGPIYYDINPYRLSSIAPYYYPGSSKMDFSFIRVPLLFTLTVPSTIRFTMKAGIFYSFNTGHNNYNSYNPYPYYPYYDYIYYPGSYLPPEVKPEKHDFGYIFSSAISYPLSDKFSASLSASIITGRKPFVENYTYKHGASEFTLGLEYTGFLKKSSSVNVSDSSKRVIVTLLGGIDYSWNGGKEPNGSYNGTTGPFLGVSLKVPIGRGTFFQTGLTFERKGFSMKDSSKVFYRLGDGPGMKYYVDSKVQVDYAIIPALLTFSFGKGNVFFSTGPWLGLKLNARNVGTAINEQHSPSDYQLRKTKIYDDIEEYITKTDAGWLAALGVKFPVLKNDVEFSVRYSGGFKDVFSGTNDKQSYSDPGLILKNRTVSFVFGVTLPYNK